MYRYPASLPLPAAAGSSGYLKHLAGANTRPPWVGGPSRGNLEATRPDPRYGVPFCTWQASPTNSHTVGSRGCFSLTFEATREGHETTACYFSCLGHRRGRVLLSFASKVPMR